MLSFVLVSMLAAATPPQSAPDAPPAVDDVAVGGHRWLLDVYPSLRRSDVGIRVYGTGEVQRLAIAEEPTALTPGASARTPLGTVDLYFNRAGHLEGMQASGRLVRGGANAALQTQVDAHPEWTTAQIDAAIVAAGGLYPSTARAALLAQTPALAKVLRRDGTLVTSALTKTADGPLWLVEVSTATRSYRLAFEPLSGQLVRVSAK